MTQGSWLDAGLKALCETGPPALKAEPLARQLNTTKGSFYWHFIDLPAFHAAVLERWETQALQDIDAPSDETTAAQLRAFGQHLADPLTARTDRAMRAWALSLPAAADSVARVDQRRGAHLARLLDQIGVSNPEMKHILQAAAIGMQAMGARADLDPQRAMGSLVDLVLALR
ncbi:TetR/AcrR family transcriptional regulator [Rhodobacteraceae bacterium KMM 6894]|nr:TetR/AcrR family transcriptional regulator [Rhodobacteraceae bacterium KMM 6894]